MIKVLVTGSGGFVGSHIVDYLLSHTDWYIVGIDSFTHKGDPLRLIDFNQTTNKRYDVFYCDLNSPISTRLKDKIGSIDYIINVASESHVDRSISDPVPFIQNNINLMLHILEYSREINPKKFIHISTDEVYGESILDYKHKEWDFHLPSNPYSASKSAQEQIAISYWRTYNIPLIIVNCMNMFGETQDNEKFIPKTISSILKKEKLPIFSTNGYIGKRYYLYVQNLSDVLLYILTNINVISYNSKIETICLPERFNISGDVEIDNLSLAKKIASIMRKELIYELVDTSYARQGYDKNYSLDNSKIISYGWNPIFSFKESLTKTIFWTLNQWSGYNEKNR